MIREPVAVWVLGLLVSAPSQAATCLAIGADPTYSNGSFALPELQSEKDSYLIVIKGPPGTDDIKLELPAGVCAIQVNQRIFPRGAWTWSHRVNLATPPSMALATPEKVHLSPTEVPLSGRYELSWPPVSGAKRYQLSGESRVKDKPTARPEWSKLSGDCSAAVCHRGKLAAMPVELKPGSELKWQISALGEDGVVLAKSAEAHLEVGNTMFQSAKGRGISFQRSDTLSAATATKPATFSYLSAQSEGEENRSTAYQAEFALIYQAPNAALWGEYFPRVSLEAHLTSRGEDKASDALRFRVGAYRHFYRPNTLEGTELAANFKYETERKSKTKKGLLELGVTPIYGPLGQYADVFSWLKVAPTVLLAVEAGKAFEVGTSEERKDTVLRFKTNLRLDAELLGVASLFGLRTTTAYLDGSYWHLPREDNTKNFRLGTAGLSFGLNDLVSLDFSYSVGRDAPAFTFERSGSIGLGLKF